MTNALMMIAGAAVFFGGFYLGLHFDTPKFEGCKNRTVRAEGGVIKNEEYRNFLNYDGTEQQ